MTTRSASIAVAAAVVLLAAAVLWWLVDRNPPVLLGQEVPTPTPHPACPDDNPGCPVFHTWPPFTVVYEIDGDSYYVDGVALATRETRELVWNSRHDWRITTLSAGDIVRPFTTMNATGSYQILKDGVLTVYDAVFDRLHTYDRSDSVPIADGVFLDILYTGYGLPDRTDGDLVVLDSFQCDGDGCDTGADRTTRASSEPTTTYGRQFEELGDVVFSEDEYRIPLLFPHSNIEVTELRTNYIATPTPGPTPTPIPTPTPAATPTPTLYAGGGAPSADSVTATSVTVSWIGPRPLGPPPTVLDTRVSYRLPGSDADWTFGAYVVSSSWSDTRPHAIVTGLTCGTQYQFQVEVQLPDHSWTNYGAFTASTGAC